VPVQGRRTCNVGKMCLPVMPTLDRQAPGLGLALLLRWAWRRAEFWAKDQFHSSKVSRIFDFCPA
jgi:hypothetical protein